MADTTPLTPLVRMRAACSGVSASALVHTVISRRCRRATKSRWLRFAGRMAILAPARLVSPEIVSKSWIDVPRLRWLKSNAVRTLGNATRACLSSATSPDSSVTSARLCTSLENATSACTVAASSIRSSGMVLREACS
ncbi:hypothetical protein D3C72_1439810 [compost metagenome]